MLLSLQHLEGAQQTHFKYQIGFGPKDSIGIFSKEHLIGSQNLKNAVVSYISNAPKTIIANKQITYHRLSIFNSMGVSSLGSLFISSHLNLSIGFLRIKKTSPTDVNSQLLVFSSKADYSNPAPKKYIDATIKIIEKSSFTFPFGTKNHLFPIRVISLAMPLDLKMAFLTQETNLPGTNVYSTKNALKRIGIQKINNKNYWNLTSSDNQKIKITITKKNAFIDSLEYKNLGICAWNIKTKNWSILPLEIQLNNTLETSYFTANNYSRITYCDCIILTKKYKPYGNYAISPNGDGINERPVFKQYTKNREGEFELYNKQGFLVFKTKWNEILNKKEDFKNKFVTGTYFYVLKLINPKQREQGYIYIKIN